jgi:hypothetical protein
MLDNELEEMEEDDVYPFEEDEDEFQSSEYLEENQR